MSVRSGREEIRVWQRTRREEGGGRTTGSELKVCDVSPPGDQAGLFLVPLSQDLRNQTH